jgi:hypothetical protein
MLLQQKDGLQCDWHKSPNEKMAMQTTMEPKWKDPRPMSLSFSPRMARLPPHWSV